MGDRDDGEYASYELASADDEPKAPAFSGDSIADALHAACSSRVRLARGTQQPSVRARGVRIATHCASRAELVRKLAPFCADRSIFVANAQGEVGTSIVFSFDLEDRTTVFCGLGIVTAQFTTEANGFGRRGISIEVTRLNADNRRFFADMLSARREMRRAQIRIAGDVERQAVAR